MLLISTNAFSQSSTEGKIYVSPDNAPRYRLFKTSNIHIFIKLDTATGLMSLIQFDAAKHSNDLSVSLNDEPLILSTDSLINGRFFLYPTDNMYTFLLQDQIDGTTWHVQWHTDEDRRMVDMIWDLNIRRGLYKLQKDE